MTREETVASVSRLNDFDIDEDDDLAIASQVIASFEEIRRDQNAHQRAVRFLHSCLKRYLWTWESLGCDAPGPDSAADAVEHWLGTGEFIDGFEKLCFPVTPRRNGETVEDCDEPALSDLSSASSRLLYFCVTRNATDAAMVVLSLFWADAEGLEADDGEGLCDWLASEGVSIAWDQEGNVK